MPTRLTQGDVRIAACVADAGGNVFYIVCDGPDYRAELWKCDSAGKRTMLRQLYGEKHSAVALCISGSTLIVQYGARIPGTATGNPLHEERLQGVAVAGGSGAGMTEQQVKDIIAKDVATPGTAIRGHIGAIVQKLLGG